MNKLKLEWEAYPKQRVMEHCSNFNAVAKKHSSGKILDKSDIHTWGKCASDCIRHLEILVRKT